MRVNFRPSTRGQDPGGVDHFPTDCLDTFAGRAASATLPHRPGPTTRSWSSRRPAVPTVLQDRSHSFAGQTRKPRPCTSSGARQRHRLSRTVDSARPWPRRPGGRRARGSSPAAARLEEYAVASRVSSYLTCGYGKFSPAQVMAFRRQRPYVLRPRGNLSTPLKERLLRWEVSRTLEETLSCLFARRRPLAVLVAP